MKKIPENVRNILNYLIVLVFGAVVIFGFYLPEKRVEWANNAFAEPLFEHALPEGAYHVQNSAVRDEAGGTTAAVLMGTSLTPEELIAFYGDVEYPPANAGETVTLDAKLVDESGIGVIKQAGKYREGDSYAFVYIYSRP